MTDGISSLDQRIARFEELLEEMKEATQEAHSALKQMRIERREIERFLSTETKQMIEQRVDDIVKKELDHIGPTIREQTNQIYDRVGHEIQRLIDISLGKEFAHANGREDIRPMLALKLRIWLQEIIEAS
jgi:uncharacterized protein involved in exopolysaccharide biosynthesis